MVGQSPYYLPNVVGSNVTLCPGQTATVEVVPDADQTFVEYQWVADWQGGGGTIEDGQGDSVAELTAGLYQLTVTDGEGCQGRYTFPIAETSVNIPDFSVPAICDFSEEVAEDSAPLIARHLGRDHPHPGARKRLGLKSLRRPDGIFHRQEVSAVAHGGVAVLPEEAPQR